MNRDKHIGRPEPSDPMDDQIEQELAEAMGGQDMHQILAANTPKVTDSDHTAPQNRSNDLHGSMGHRVVRGRIAEIHGDDVFVNLHGMDGKNQGVVPLSQFEREPRMGSVMDFVLQRVDPSQGLMILSKEGSIGKATWDQLFRGSVVEARVTGSNKGGLELELAGGIKAFMPASGIDLHYVENLEQFVGQKLRAQVQEINRHSQKVVLNRRGLLENERQAKQAQLWDELQIGQTRQGTISSIAEYGVFVDLGGMDGMVHVSDLSYSRVNNPSDVVNVGETVTVQILKIDREKNRISLGMKQAKSDPWIGIDQKYAPGSLIEATVSSIVDFGAFVQLEQGVEGLVHISELSHKRINYVSDVLQIGQTESFRVIAVDAENRRISLSLKTVDVPTQQSDSPSDVALSQVRRKEAHKKLRGPLKGGIE